MFFNHIKHNLIIIFCILLLINGCNNENSKLIIENNSIAKKTKKSDKLIVNKKNLKKKLFKSTTLEINKITPKEKITNDIIFEFRNERLLQGRNISNNKEEEKTKIALSAVQKMFKRNLSSNETELNLKNDYDISTLNRYIFEKKQYHKLSKYNYFFTINREVLKFWK